MTSLGFPAPGVPVPDGSIAIEDLFESYYTLVGEPYDDAQFSGRSDYQAFILNGIPAGGLFTGAEVVKTEEQEAIWGGTRANNSIRAITSLAMTSTTSASTPLTSTPTAVAVAVLTYAYSTETVNSVVGSDVPGGFTLPAPAGPEGTSAGGGAFFQVD